MSFFRLCIGALVVGGAFFFPLAAQVYRSADGDLRRATYSVENGEETFALMSSGGNVSIVSGDDEVFVHIRYDGNAHIESKTVWRSENGREASKESLTEYVYTAGASRPASRVVTNFTAQTREVTTYTPSGNVQSVVLYRTAAPAKEESPEAAGSAETGSPEVLSSRTDVRYDGQGRKIEETRRTDGGVETTRYEYTRRSRNPDTTVLVNGEVTNTRVYASDTRWTDTFYFDGGFAAEAVYANGNQVGERFLLNGVEIRRDL